APEIVPVGERLGEHVLHGILGLRAVAQQKLAAPEDAAAVLRIKLAQGRLGVGGPASRNERQDRLAQRPAYSAGEKAHEVSAPQSWVASYATRLNTLRKFEPQHSEPVRVTPAVAMSPPVAWMSQRPAPVSCQRLCTVKCSWAVPPVPG